MTSRSPSCVPRACGAFQSLPCRNPTWQAPPQTPVSGPEATGRPRRSWALSGQSNGPGALASPGGRGPWPWGKGSLFSEE